MLRCMNADHHPWPIDTIHDDGNLMAAVRSILRYQYQEPVTACSIFYYHTKLKFSCVGVKPAVGWEDFLVLRHFLENW